MKPSAIIRLGNPVVGEWATGDGILLDGQVQLGKGKAASTASIDLADPRLALANSLPTPQRSERVPVDVWWGERPAPALVFSGYLSSIECSGLPGKLTIKAADKARGMRRSARARNLTDTSAGQLCQRLAADHEFELDVSCAPNLDQYSFSELLQHGESDWEVMHRVLEATGHRSWIRGNTIFVAEVGYAGDADLYEVTFGENVKNGFSFQVDELTRHTTPNLFDETGQLYISDPELDQDATERYVRLERTGLVLPSADTPSWTSQAIERAALAQARARQLFRGRLDLTVAAPELDVTSQLLLRGFGPRFSGAWNVEGVTHHLKGGTTSCEIANGGSSV